MSKRKRRYRERKPLKQHELESLAAPDVSGRQKVYMSADFEGLGVLVSGRTSRKTWICQRGNIRLTIGPAHVFSFAEACEKATDLIKQILNGQDPRRSKAISGHPEIAPKDGTITLQQALDKYLASGKLSDISKHNYGYVAQRYLGDWLDQPLTAITRPMVTERYEAIKARAMKGRNGHCRNGIATGNLVMAMLGAVWNATADNGYISGESPTKALQRRTGRKAGSQLGIVEQRRTMLPDDQLPTLYAAICDLRATNSIQADYLLTILFTGLRRSTASGLRWDELVRDGRLLRFPRERMKARKPFQLPVPDMIFDRLDSRPRLKDCPYVFPASSGGGHLNSGAKALAALAKRYDLMAVEHDEAGNVIREALPCLHDLRRGFSRIAHQVTDFYTAESLLAHVVSRNDIAGGYRVVTLEDKRKAMDAIADRLVELCRAKPALVDKVA